MHSECVSLCSGSPLWCLKRPCVWSEWFLSSRSEPVSDTSDCSLTHTHTHAHTDTQASTDARTHTHIHTVMSAKRERSNKQGLFDPAAAQQPAKLPLS